MSEGEDIPRTGIFVYGADAEGWSRAAWYFLGLSADLDSSIPHCALHAAVPVGLRQSGGGCIVVMAREQARLRGQIEFDFASQSWLTFIASQPGSATTALLQETGRSVCLMCASVFFFSEATADALNSGLPSRTGAIQA